MSELRDIKKIVLATPNDADLGAKIRQYVVEHIVCCDNFDNLYTKKVTDGGPYGWDVETTHCLVCGKILNTKIDK